MKIEHKELEIDIELKDLYQRDLEDFYSKMREQNENPDNLSVPEYSGNVLRIAQELKWLELGEVDDMKPATVIYIQRAISQHVLEAMTIPPE